MQNFINKSEFLKTFLFRFKANLFKIFSGRNLIWHGVAIVLTYVIVTTGFDWAYFKVTQIPAIDKIIFPAIVLGGLVPLLGPTIMYFIYRHKNKKLARIAAGVGQAALLGWLVSSFYKAFTGRIHPTPFTSVAGADISHGFRFGFLRGGIFWGWPSSHTTVAFAMALALCMMYPKNKQIWFWSLLTAMYVGLSVSVSIHWFSEFVAGAIIGSVIGLTVGRSSRGLLEM